MEDKAGTEEMFFHAQKDMTEMVGNNHIVTVGNAHVQSTETLWMSTVHDSVIVKTQDGVLIRHGASSIYLDDSGIRLNFGTDHVLTLNASGVHLHSAAQVDASQGDGSPPPNYVSVRRQRRARRGQRGADRCRQRRVVHPDGQRRHHPDRAVISSIHDPGCNPTCDGARAECRFQATWCPPR